MYVPHYTPPSQSPGVARVLPSVTIVIHEVLLGGLALGLIPVTQLPEAQCHIYSPESDVNQGPFTFWHRVLKISPCVMVQIYSKAIEMVSFAGSRAEDGCL